MRFLAKSEQNHKTKGKNEPNTEHLLYRDDRGFDLFFFDVVS
jgi:hypothetical protein